MAVPLYLTHKIGRYDFYRYAFTVAILLSLLVFVKLYVCLLCIYVGYKVFRPIYESLYVPAIEPTGRGVFITGCDSGFGHKLAESLDERGFTVFASCLDEKGHGAKRLRNIGSKRLHFLQVDVTKEKSIKDAGLYVQKHLPRKGLWAIVNNAGINFLSDVELATVRDFDKCLAINFYGPIRMCKQFLPLIRKSKGRIVNVTSVHGRMSMPRQVIYETSKHALETLSDSLRLEMKKFGVKVSIVQPGAFTTSIGSEVHVKRITEEIQTRWQNAPPGIQKTYKLDDLLTFLPRPAEFRWPPGDELMPVVRAIQHAISSPYPEHRYTVCGKGKRIRFIDEFVVVAKLYTLLPTWIVDKYMAHWRDAWKFRLN